MCSAALREGNCFKAIGVACRRTSAHIHVKAEEIHMVDSENNPTLGTSGDAGRRSENMGPARPSVEKRKVIPATSFVIDAPTAHLRHERTRNGVTIIALQTGSLPTEDFPAMTFQDGVGYGELNVASVLLGLDVCMGNHWITPMAFNHIRSVWQTVQDAGGVFVVDFELSRSKWARFSTAYMCPAPTDTVQYIHRHKLRKRNFLGGLLNSSLLDAGGKVYTSNGFQPSRTNLEDPDVLPPVPQSVLLPPNLNREIP